MRPFTDTADLQRGQELLSGMMETEPGRTYEFDTDWVRKAGWKVVPAEDTGHFAPIEISSIVRALKDAGHEECLAIASEPIDPAPSCYRLSLSETDLLDFNAECGPFRFVLTDATRSWAISCNEWYNLFAGKPDLIEAMLAEPIEQARGEFLEFALMAEGNPDGPIMQVAHRYAAL